MVDPPVQFKDKYSDRLKVSYNKKNSPALNKTMRKTKIEFIENDSGHTMTSDGKLMYDDEGFEYVESRNSIRKRRLIENVNRCCLVGAPPPPVSIWLYKVVRGDIETIKNFMVNKNISVHDIKKISNSEAKYMSYKITIPKNFIKDVLNKSFWPPGIGCRI